MFGPEPNVNSRCLERIGTSAWFVHSSLRQWASKLSGPLSCASSSTGKVNLDRALFCLFLFLTASCRLGQAAVHNRSFLASPPRLPSHGSASLLLLAINFDGSLPHYAQGPISSRRFLLGTGPHNIGLHHDFLSPLSYDSSGAARSHRSRLTMLLFLTTPALPQVPRLGFSLRSNASFSQDIPRTIERL